MRSVNTCYVTSAVGPGKTDFISSSFFLKANPIEPGWQWSFYGPNYARLREIKDYYDPEGLLWCPQCVGSEDWLQQQDGKLCRPFATW